MDLPAELRDFLASRRARLTPETAGISPFGGKRRVPGLRREEVAYLAGVSVDYYTRLERGRSKGVSTEVTDAVARALQLSATEHEHLRNLIDGSRSHRPPSVHAASALHDALDGLQTVLDVVTVPAFVQNERLDLLGANKIGRALYSLSDASPHQTFNLARFFFLDVRSADFYRDRPRVARHTVAMLRAAAGRHPDDNDLMNLIGHLSIRSAEFRRLWAGQDVLRYRAGAKRFTHPLVGELNFAYQSFDVPASPGLTMVVYTTEPGGSTDESLQLLASWTASEAPQPAGGESIGDGAVPQRVQTPRAHM